MKVLTRYTVVQVLKVGIITALLGSFMLLGVDLFSNLDTYTKSTASGFEIFIITILYFPEAFLLAMGPSFLFSVSYFLSMLYANNEIMCILNSGVDMKRIIRPIVILAFIVGAFYFIFNETVAINASNEKEVRSKTLTNSEDESLDNSEVALSDMQSGYMVYANEYIDSRQELHDVTFIRKTDSSIERIDAFKACYNKDDGDWTFYDCSIFENADSSVAGRNESFVKVEEMRLEPELFRNLSTQVSRMDLRMASEYVRKMKMFNPDQYASIGTEYYKRVYSFLTPLVLMLIACSMNYRFKKNVLFFSIICSICVAVVYYVVQMVTIMLADQGVIRPYMGMIIPFMAVILFTSALSAIMKS